MLHAHRIGVFCRDEARSRELQRYFVSNGFLSDVIHDSNNALCYAQSAEPVAIYMDLEQDPENGLHQISILRQNQASCVIIAAGPAENSDIQIRSLGNGADDYVSLPVHAEEVFQRLKIVLNKVIPDSTSARRISASDITEMLTPTEMRIVEVLRDSAPNVLSREQIMWRAKKQRTAPDDRTVDVYISHIRRKLKLLGAEVAIETVRGKGFRHLNYQAAYDQQREMPIARRA